MRNKKAYIWALLGQFAPQGIFLLTTMILARYVSPTEFGQISVLSVFLAIAQVLIDGGLGGSLIKEDKLTEQDKSTVAIFNIFLSLIIYFVIFLCADALETFYNSPNLADVARLLCLVFVINAWGLVPRSMLYRELRFKVYSSIVISAVSVSAILAVFLAINDYGVYSLVGYQLCQAFCIVLGCNIYSRYRMSLQWSVSSLKKLMPFGIFTTLCAIVDSIYENVLANLIGKFVGIQEAGFFNQAQKLENVPTKSLSLTINTVTFPILSRINKDKNAFMKEAKTVYTTILLLITPLLFTVSFFSETIITILYGTGWKRAAPYLSLLMIAGLFIMMENLVRNFIKSLGIVQQLFSVTLIKRSLGIVIIIISLIISPSLLLPSFIISSVLAYMLNTYIYTRYMEINYWSSLMNTLTLLIPAIIYILLLSCFSAFVKQEWFLYSSALLLLITYYIIILSVLKKGNSLTIKKNYDTNE